MKKEKLQVSLLPISCLNDSEIQKGDFRELKSKTFLGGACPPQIPIEACAFGARLGNPSVCILDPRLEVLLKFCMKSGAI